MATSKNPIKVLIVEDFRIVRIGLSMALKDTEDICVVGEAETGEEALVLVNELNPDIILLDLGLPDISGIEVMQEIRKQNQDIQFIILTSHDSSEEVLHSLNAGAKAYCLKDIPSDELIDVIRHVYDGGAWLSPLIADLAMQVFSNPMVLKQSDQKLDYALSERERDILRLIIDGKTNQEIADTMYLSIHTVKMYVTEVFRKLSVTDRTQAAVKALKSNMFSP